MNSSVANKNKKVSTLESFSQSLRKKSLEKMDMDVDDGEEGYPNKAVYGKDMKLDQIKQKTRHKDEIEMEMEWEEEEQQNIDDQDIEECDYDDPENAKKIPVKRTKTSFGNIFSGISKVFVGLKRSLSKNMSFNSSAVSIICYKKIER